jgi:hypothetical protein
MYDEIFAHRLILLSINTGAADVVRGPLASGKVDDF